MDVEELMGKIRRFAEKYGWVLIIALLIALIVSVLALIRERNKKGKGES